MIQQRTQKILDWYRGQARGFFVEFAPERVRDFDKDSERIEERARRSDEPAAMCFLGSSAIGKSTLINALVAGHELVLPSGGTGPLTAQATSVRYAPEPYFAATYHARKSLWSVAFVLEQRHTARVGVTLPRAQDEYGSELDPAELRRLSEEAREASSESEAAQTGAALRLKEWEKQARLLVTGNQDSSEDLPYLLDGLRGAMGLEPRWEAVISPDDAHRLGRLRSALELAAQGRCYERKGEGASEGFLADLREHASGALAPLIARLDVGWPSDLLRQGLVLVDLPGVGIANDIYRRVTRDWINANSRGVVLVVDRGGVTDACAALLQESGFLTRLLAASDDPQSDPMTLAVAVTRVDDVADTRYAEDPKRKKREHFAAVCEEMVPRIREQMRQQLEGLEVSSHRLAEVRQRDVIARVLEELRVFPVSAPQYRRVLADDEDDRSWLKSVEETRVPQLVQHLVEIAVRWRQGQQARESEAASNLLERIEGTLRAVEAQWSEQTRAAAEGERLREQLERDIAPHREELAALRGAFQEFLRRSAEETIRELVDDALHAAAKDMHRHLKPFEREHWAVLRAAVRHNGVWRGVRTINLIERFTDDCETPIVAVWGEKILRDIRGRTRELALEFARLVEKVADWAAESGVGVQAERVRELRDSIRAESKALERVGRDAVDELRGLVRTQLRQVIEPLIKRCCEDFVGEGSDRGRGVKDRMLELLQTLPEAVVDAVREPAVQGLQQNFREVRVEIDARLEQLSDPLGSAADLVVSSHEMRTRRSDAQKRGRVLEAIRGALEQRPPAGGSFDFGDESAG